MLTNDKIKIAENIRGSVDLPCLYFVQIKYFLRKA